MFSKFVCHYHLAERGSRWRLTGTLLVYEDVWSGKGKVGVQVWAGAGAGVGVAVVRYCRGPHRSPKTGLAGASCKVVCTDSHLQIPYLTPTPVRPFTKMHADFPGSGCSSYCCFYAATARHYL